MPKELIVVQTFWVDNTLQYCVTQIYKNTFYFQQCNGVILKFVLILIPCSVSVFIGRKETRRLFANGAIWTSIIFFLLHLIPLSPSLSLSLSHQVFWHILMLYVERLKNCSHLFGWVNVKKSTWISPSFLKYLRLACWNIFAANFLISSMYSLSYCFKTYKQNHVKWCNKTYSGIYLIPY